MLGLGGNEKIHLTIILQIIIIFTVIQNTYLIGIIHDSYSQYKHTDHMAVTASIYHIPRKVAEDYRKMKTSQLLLIHCPIPVYAWMGKLQVLSFMRV